MNTGRQASQRATLHVDVGPELSARVRAAAAAGGRTPSEWTRELLQRELAQETASADTGRQQQSGSDASAAAPGRLVLDAERQLRRARTELVKARGDQRIRLAEIEKMVGEDL